MRHICQKLELLLTICVRPPDPVRLLYVHIFRYLLEAAADVHAQTQTGDTALTYACENGHTDVADLLLQYGADLVLYFTFNSLKYEVYMYD
jgi:ankyrin repeat protein